MKVKKGHSAHQSGMRGKEDAPETKDIPSPMPADQGLTPASDAPAKKPEKAGAYDSGMRGAEKPVAKAQEIAKDVAQNPQLGAGTEAIAQGEMPPEYDAGDHYAIPKSHLIDGGDHYKLPKKKPSA